jgi:hypothetical protein
MATTHIERAVGRGIFGSDAASYECGRLDYPPEIYDAITAEAVGAIQRLFVTPRYRARGPGS